MTTDPQAVEPCRQTECAVTIVVNQRTYSVMKDIKDTIDSLRQRVAELEVERLATASLLASAEMHISSWYIDWAKLNRESPDYDPAYDPTPDFPAIVSELSTAVVKLRGNAAMAQQKEGKV